MAGNYGIDVLFVYIRFHRNKTQMQVIFLLTIFCIFVSFCISIYILSASYHSVIHIGLSTLEQFP